MRCCFLMIAAVLSSSCGGEPATYACELDGQCQYAFDLESNPSKQDADELRASCDALGGTFSRGECSPAIAICAYSGQRERHFYDGFAPYQTHTDAEALERVCALEGGTLEILEQPCAADDDCSDGIGCNGVERCVVQETCTAICTQAACEAGTPVCAADEVCDPESDACLPR